MTVGTVGGGLFRRGKNLAWLDKCDVSVVFVIELNFRVYIMKTHA